MQAPPLYFTSDLFPFICLLNKLFWHCSFNIKLDLVMIQVYSTCQSNKVLKYVWVWEKVNKWWCNVKFTEKEQNMNSFVPKRYIHHFVEFFTFCFSGITRPNLSTILFSGKIMDSWILWQHPDCYTPHAWRDYHFFLCVYLCLCVNFNCWLY